MHTQWVSVGREWRLDGGWEWRVGIPHSGEGGCGVRMWEAQVCVH